MADEPEDINEIAICNRCNMVRTLTVHPCPGCKCPEYRIEVVSTDRYELVRDSMKLARKIDTPKPVKPLPGQGDLFAGLNDEDTADA